MTWERCGNTPFYRRAVGGPLSWYFSDPFHWAHVSVAPSRDGDHVTVLFRLAPRFDRAALGRGVRQVYGGSNELVQEAAEEWARDLARAKEAGAGLQALRRLLERGPEAARAAVLDGVGALAAGFEDMDFRSGVPSGMASRLFLALKHGSPAEARAMEIQRSLPGLERTFVAKDLGKAVDLALAEVGILEC